MRVSDNTNIVAYRVVGRYMSGSNVIAYHLVGLDGRQSAVSKDRLIYMIGKGLVSNMRVQSNGNEIILRGKGINLNSLPVYDSKNNKFRDNKASKDAANTAVMPKKDTGINPMGQLKIVKRILHKTTCLGYVVTDFSNNTRKLKRDKVIELALQKLISNATVQKYRKTPDSKPILILRGAGCNLSELPALIVDSNGRIVDPSLDKGEVKIRATRMRRGGIIHDKKNNRNITFEAGDFIVCGYRGELAVIDKEEIMTKYKVDNSSKAAICDENCKDLCYYPIEIFGTTSRELTREQILKWSIINKAVN